MICMKCVFVFERVENVIRFVRQIRKNNTPKTITETVRVMNDDVQSILITLGERQQNVKMDAVIVRYV